MPDNEIVRLDDIIGRIEAEKLLGIRPRTFARWLAEGKLPKPAKTLEDGTKLWLRQDVRFIAEKRDD